VECVCPPLEVRCRWLAVKFLLKSLSSPHSLIFNYFVDVFNSWRYVKKTLPILASVASSLAPLSSIILRPQKRLFLYDASFCSLISIPSISINPLFLGYSLSELRFLSPHLVNNLFYSFVSSEFPNYSIIYTDGSVSSNSAGFSFYIPSLQLCFSDCLPYLSSSFSAEGFALIHALRYIHSLPPNSFLIVTDSQSLLYSIMGNPFKSGSSVFSIFIRSLIADLEAAGHLLKFLWVPSHVGITGNEKADSLAKVSASSQSRSIHKIPYSDLIPHFHRVIRNAWRSQWTANTATASWFKSSCSDIPRFPWFSNINLSRFYIISFCRLRFGHNRLPSHAYYLNLNSSPYCPLHDEIAVCDFRHILFSCPSVAKESVRLLCSTTTILSGSEII
jgi:ribonuclease HI